MVKSKILPRLSGTSRPIQHCWVGLRHKGSKLKASLGYNIMGPFPKGEGGGGDGVGWQDSKWVKSNCGTEPTTQIQSWRRNNSTKLPSAPTMCCGMCALKQVNHTQT